MIYLYIFRAASQHIKLPRYDEYEKYRAKNRKEVHMLKILFNYVYDDSEWRGLENEDNDEYQEYIFWPR